MYKTLSAAVFGLFFIPTAAFAQDWVGHAISPTGQMYSTDPMNSESRARSIAKSDCESATQRTCAAIAVKSWADVYGIVCQRGSRKVAFIGGSGINEGGARWLAYDKARQAGFESYECS